MVWEKIKRAAENESDIVVFPEMLGNPEMSKFISEKIKALSEEERKKMPALTILPSYCKKRLNIVTILDRNGDRVCRQCKQNPFMIETREGSILEGIRSNNIINILHYEGIGRIAILICKDFLTTKYMEHLMRCFKLTLIIVPSYSTGSYDFIQSFDLCAHDDCNVIWLNTCAAMQPGKEANFKSVGFVRKRIGRNDDDSQKLCSMPVCEGAFERKCSHDCIYFQTIKGV
jgi:predicted amidohydrolase